MPSVRDTSTAKPPAKVAMPTKADMHWKRKTFHAFFGVALSFIAMQQYRWNHEVLTFFTVMFVIGEFARLRLEWVNTMQQRVLGHVMREHEINSPSGTVYFLSSLLICHSWFPVPVMALSSAVMGIGDPAASIFGIKFGKLTPILFGKKSLAGAVGCFIASFITVVSFWSLFGGPLSPFQYSSLMLAVVISATSAAAETFAQAFDLDDNFVLPLAVSSITVIFSEFAGWNLQ